MRDIPFFTTENGVASLILKEIVYKKEAYIRLQDSVAPDMLLRECVDFCVAAGAQKVYATGHDCLTCFPIHTTIIRMCRTLQGMPQTDAALFPVQEKTFDAWRSIYNERMCGVSCAATIAMSDEKKLLASGSAYFVHRAGVLLGIGKASGEQIEAVASVVRGAGRDVLLALCNALSGDTAALEVAQDNTAATRLYEQVGFVTAAQVSRWYTVR